ncbi:hypothetical protein JMF89_11320 [Clostridiaceae bacterium UIB06]|uniref:Uncharacterized protein n=1 Tax=Clostridium thailandense TaxID=2794346 RepID=A0A949WU59_9CLOT|nr:hypothetical protein [Clostridium thailandense]MBV7272242.1 hypothetical protein [Clostridium thailandense]MCH5137788.1 hypothetical protein [Clostridiaceae bacterium UIB06]
MNLNISQSEAINFYDGSNTDYYIKRTPSVKTSIDLPLSTVSNLSQDSIEISNDARSQCNYITEFKTATTVTNHTPTLENITTSSNTFISSDSIDPEFIKNYSLKYVEIRKEILENSSQDEAAKKINLLDTAYNDAINSAAGSLASDFQNFFDYASNEWSYNNSEGEINKFDVDAFKNNILSLANEAFSVVKQAFNDNNFDNLQSKLENKLSNIQSGTTIESMNYTDIKEVDNFLKNLPKLKNHVKEYFDDGTYRPVSGNWTTSDAVNAINLEYTMAKNFLNSGGAYDSVKKTVYNTTLKNISSYHKRFAFDYQSDQNQDQINKDRNNYKLLKEQYENFEKKLDAAKKQNNMKMVLTYLEILNGLKTQLAEATAKLKDDTEAQNKLSKNPNNVVETEAYKDISNGEIFNENQD